MIIFLHFFLLFISAAFFNEIFAQNNLEKIVNISQSPIKSFEKNCSRCHGEEGSAYGKEFAQLDDLELKKVVEDMMFGPAFMNPTEVEIDAMTAYNRALKDYKPFAIVINAESFLNGNEKELEISISPGAELTIENENVKIKKEDDLILLFFDPEKIKQVNINVKKDNKSSAFIFPKELWTN